jgi:hypothetical protein
MVVFPMISQQIGRLVKGGALRAAGLAAGVLHRAGREDLAGRVSRWAIVFAGTGYVLEHVGPTPTEAELRAVCHALAAELGADDPVAGVFSTLAEQSTTLTMDELVRELDANLDNTTLSNAQRLNEVLGALKVLLHREPEAS